MTVIEGRLLPSEGDPPNLKVAAGEEGERQERGILKLRSPAVIGEGEDFVPRAGLAANDRDPREPRRMIAWLTPKGKEVVGRLLGTVGVMAVLNSLRC